MKYEDIERQPFEAFGEIEAFEAPETAESAEEVEEIDLSQNDMSFTEAEIAEPARIETVETIEPIEPQRVKTAFSWAAFGGGLAALVWIGGAIGGPISYYGLDAVLTMDPAMQAGLIALAFGPAILFWLAAAAAGEALKARKLAVELTRLAQEGRAPAVEAHEAHAQRLSLTVKNEIEALNDAVHAALHRLAELETAAQRNTALFDGAIAATRENTEYMAARLADEREALMQLNGDLKGQTDSMSQTIGRQIRLMREASKLVKTEITAAEDALETHLASFTASATVMAERTASFHEVADSAAAATSSLNAAMSEMLDGLSEATRMTDAARQSSEQAVLAANETAAAVRETTRSAVFEAKRAAQLIRAESAALQETAAETLDKLQAAANAARAASEESQAAADRHAAKIEQRLSALASTAGAKKQAAPRPAAQQQRQPAPQRERAPERKPVEQPLEVSSLQAAANAAVARGRAQARAEAQAETRQARGGIASTLKGLGGWGNFLPQMKNEDMPKPANEAEAYDFVDFGSPKNPDAALKEEAVDLVFAAGVDLAEVLRQGDLERIAQQSRHGALARRCAVSDAAPGAVSRIVRHVKRNSEARAVANAFRARPDLAKSDKKGEGPNLVRAYLLIDAALA